MPCLQSFRKKPKERSSRQHRHFVACELESIRHSKRRRNSMADTLKAGPSGRSRARASVPETNSEEERDQQFDLLTAALIGAAVGAVVTLIFRTGPSGRRPIAPML